MAQWFESHGWVVVGRNVRVGADEIDVVALDGAQLVVVEVRSARAGAMVHPLATLDTPKLKRLRRAAVRYAIDHDLASVRIDVVAVIGSEIEWLANAVDFTAT